MLARDPGTASDHVFLFYVPGFHSTQGGGKNVFFCYIDNHLLVQDLYSMSPEGAISTVFFFENFDTAPPSN